LNLSYKKNQSNSKKTRFFVAFKKSKFKKELNNSQVTPSDFKKIIENIKKPIEFQGWF